jgi:hypothetical protein
MKKGTMEASGRWICSRNPAKSRFADKTPLIRALSALAPRATSD